MKHDPVDFQKDVIERSQQIPVLVDFWAPWCGPCKVLGPILNQLVEEAGNSWVLVKVDTEEHQDLAARFGIRSIPNVKLFHRGAVIAEFAGALPEPELREWLRQNIPSPKREVMGQARELLREGKTSAAVDLLRPLHSAFPTDVELGVLLARALVFAEPKEALKLVDNIPADSAWQDGSQIVRAFAEAFIVPPVGSLLGTQHEKYISSLVYLKSGDYRKAAAVLVEVLEREPNYGNGCAKAVCLALFKHLGMRHPITEEFFRSYSMAVNC